MWRMSLILEGKHSDSPQKRINLGYVNETSRN